MLKKLLANYNIDFNIWELAYQNNNLSARFLLHHHRNLPDFTRCFPCYINMCP